MKILTFGTSGLLENETAWNPSLLQSEKPGLIISNLTEGKFMEQYLANKAMADYTKAVGGRMLYISSVSVFDGKVSGGHTTKAAPYSLSQYGDFKQNCEAMLLWSLGKQCLVARLPRIVSDEMSKREVFYENLYFNYGTKEDVRAGICECVDEGRFGVVHLVGDGCMSDGECARKVLGGKGLRMAELTAEGYCEILGCGDVGKLLRSGDGGFYLTMVGDGN